MQTVVRHLRRGDVVEAVGDIGPGGVCGPVRARTLGVVSFNEPRTWRGVAAVLWADGQHGFVLDGEVQRVEDYLGLLVWNARGVGLAVDARLT